MDLEAGRCFVETVEAGTITEAAARLGLSRPTLSRRLAGLEAELGLALLHRSTRAVRPTRVGQRLYQRLAPLLADVRGLAAELEAEVSDVVGCLTVSVPPPLAPEVSGLLVQMQERFPALEVVLLGEARLADLRGHMVEVALRAGPVSDPDLVVRKLAARPVRAVAAPAYLDAAGRPTTLACLGGHVLLAGRRPDGSLRGSWPLRDGRRVPVASRFSTDDQQALLHAALAGGGIALLSEVTYGPALESGQLELVLPEQVGTELPLQAVVARRTLQPRRIRAFLDAAVAWFESAGSP